MIGQRRPPRQYHFIERNRDGRIRKPRRARDNGRSDCGRHGHQRGQNDCSTGFHTAEIEACAKRFRGGASQHDGPHGIIFGSPPQASDDGLDHSKIQRVDRWAREDDPRDAVCDLVPNRIV